METRKDSIGPKIHSGIGIGVIFACLSTIMGGGQAAATRFVVVDDIGPIELAVVRFALALLMFWPLLPLLDRTRTRLHRSDVIPVFGMGVLFFGIFPILFSAAFQYATAARGALVLGTLPILTLLLARLVGREQLSAGKIGGAILVFLGVGIVAGEGAFSTENPEAWKGDLMMFGGALIGAVYNVYLKPYLVRGSAIRISAYVMTSGFATLLLIGLVTGSVAISDPIPDLTFTVWAVIFYLAASTFIAMIFWNLALKSITPTQSSVAIGLNPTTAMVLGALVLGEAVGLILIAGLALVLVGIVMTARSK